MGLFNSLKKKKPENSNSTSKEHLDVPNFDQLLAEAPAPPSELSKTQFSPGTETIPSESSADIPVPEPAGIPPPLPNESKQEIPPFDQTPMNQQVQPPLDQGIPEMPSQPEPQANIPEQGLFELPDFDEDEIKQLESLSEEEKDTPIDFGSSVHDEHPIHESFDEPLSEPLLELDIDYPKNKRPAILPELKYLKVGKFLDVINTLNETRVVARNTEDLLEKHTETSTSKNDKYKSLITNLNLIQDKIVFIDNKLF